MIDLSKVENYLTAGIIAKELILLVSHRQQLVGPDWYAEAEITVPRRAGLDSLEHFSNNYLAGLAVNLVRNRRPASRAALLSAAGEYQSVQRFHGFIMRVTLKPGEDILTELPSVTVKAEVQYDPESRLAPGIAA